MTTQHGERLRRRQIAWKLLDRLDALAFIPSIRWLRFLRIVLLAAAVGCYFTVSRMEALLLLLLVTPVEIAIIGRSLVEVLRQSGE